MASVLSTTEGVLQSEMGCWRCVLIVRNCKGEVK
jgi:hypothetical protein